MIIKKSFCVITIFLSVFTVGCSFYETELLNELGDLQRDVSNLRTQIGQLQAVIEDSAEKDTVYPFVLIISDVLIAEDYVGITGTRIDRFGNTEEYSFGSKGSPDTAITLNGELIGWEDLSVGDVISLTYSGGILESNPAGFENPITAIKIIGRVKQ